jgi:hypothetical protein
MVPVLSADLPRVPCLFSYMGSRGVRWPPLGKAFANEGSSMCSLLSLVLYPKRAHSTSQTLSADY